MTDEAMSPLRRRMIEDMTIRKFTPETQHDYVQRVKNFAAFLGRSPDTASFEGRAPLPDCIWLRAALACPSDWSRLTWPALARPGAHRAQAQGDPAARLTRNACVAP